MMNHTHADVSCPLRSSRIVGVFQNVAPMKKPYSTCKISCVVGTGTEGGEGGRGGKGGGLHS